MGQQKQESQGSVIDLEKFQNLKAYYQRREQERLQIIELVAQEVRTALRQVDAVDFDYAVGILTEHIWDIGESYSELPGRSLNTQKRNPDLYKSRTDIAAELKKKAVTIWGKNE